MYLYILEIKTQSHNHLILFSFNFYRQIRVQNNKVVFDYYYLFFIQSLL